MFFIGGTLKGYRFGGVKLESQQIDGFGTEWGKGMRRSSRVVDDGRGLGIVAQSG